MKLLVLLVCVFGLAVAADEKPGNFTIRFEPSARLQTGTEVPFEVHVMDDRRRPLEREAKVELAIAPQNQDIVKTFKAWFVQPGVFIAKPVFPREGQWTLTVTAARQDKVSRRTITFAVAP